MPNVSPLVTYAGGQPLYGSSFAAGIYGLSSNLTWNSAGGGIYSATLTPIPCKNEYVLTASVQKGTLTDASNCRLIQADAQGNTLFFWLLGNPATPTTFAIAWRLTPPPS
jgi:hypothetical protein